jgi:predicted RNA-binding Zn ribbon-like protein
VRYPANVSAGRWSSLYDDEPGGRVPAPGSLRLVQQYLNTVDIEAANDGFAEPAGVRSWFLGEGLLSSRAGVGTAERQLAIEAREALRDLVAANTGASVHPASIRTLNGIGRSGLEVQFGTDGRAQLVAKRTDVRGGIASILAAVARAMSEGTWPRLKVCRRDACRWVFYDRSKNRSGSWCTMAICGSRTKAASYYKRTAGRSREA